MRHDKPVEDEALRLLAGGLYGEREVTENETTVPSENVVWLDITMGISRLLFLRTFRFDSYQNLTIPHANLRSENNSIKIAYGLQMVKRDEEIAGHAVNTVERVRCSLTRRSSLREDDDRDGAGGRMRA